MHRLTRRLALWGGAAAIAGAGFAFMAGNTVAASSAGEGQASVTGYTVSDITYTYGSQPTATPPGSNNSPYCYGNTQGNPYNCYLTKVQFQLTSNASSAPANGEPTSVVVAVLGSNNLPIQAGVNPASLQNGDCTLSPWNTSSGHGTATVTCTIKGGSSPPYYIKSSDVTGLDVEANQ